MTPNAEAPHARHPTSVPVPARPYQGQPAGVVTRLIAGAVDLLVVLAILGAIYGGIAAGAFLLHPSAFHWPQRAGWSIPVIGFVVVVPYLTLCWSTTGRTWGDSLLGLRVNRDGRRLHVASALLRAILCIVFPIGVLWVAISPQNRSVQDIIMRTCVIYDWIPANDPTST